MTRAGAFRVGTSGFVYAHWRGDFYPRTLPARRWFEHYAARFDTVEINNTFYRLPEAATFERWHDAAPRGFLYAMKFSRYGTHLKHLKDPRATIEAFVDRAERLKSHLGPILVQLPPRWKVDAGRLDAFLREMPRRLRVAVELRDRSWLAREVYDVLEAQRAALVLHDLVPRHPMRLTADWTYLRFHGASYGGNYAARTLAARARRIAQWLRAGHDVYAYFNNDRDGHAPRNAAELRRRVGAGTSRPHGPQASTGHCALPAR